MPSNRTREEKEAQARSDLAAKIRFEQPLARSMEGILNAIYRDFEAFYSITGQAFNPDTYEPEVIAALTGTYRDATDYASGRHIAYAEDNQDDGLYLALLLLAFMSRRSITEQLDFMRAQERVQVAEFINENTVLSAQYINATTARQMVEQTNRVIADGFENGESLTNRQIATRTTERLRQNSPGRARMIAATEVQKAVEGSKQLDTEFILGSLAPPHLAGYIIPTHVKEWVTQGDEVVRPAHVEADSQQQLSSDPYIVGGEELMYPGDPAGSIENIAYCRCDSQQTLDIDITQIGQEQLARLPQ